MTTGAAGSDRSGSTANGSRPRRRRLVVVGAVVTTLAVLATLSVSTLAWGATLREDARLLPGTTIATLDVGGATVDEARATVAADLTERLARPIELVHGDERWETRPDELGAHGQVEETIADAFDRTTAAGFAELARLRWADADAGLELDVPVTAPDEQLSGLVAEISEDVDRAPVDARFAWDGRTLRVVPATDGLELDQERALGDLGETVTGDATHLELPVRSVPPTIGTEDLRERLAEVQAAVDTALDRTLTIADGDDTWSVTPRELGAEPDLDGLIRLGTEVSDELAATTDVRLEAPDAGLTPLLETIGADVAREPQNATMHWADGPQVTPERDGRTLDAQTTAADVAEALATGGNHVEAAVDTVRAAITTTTFDRALVLHQPSRQLYLYDGDALVRQWSVAVGKGDSPTPTGIFTVGAKRYEPTWHNPSPDGWGEDMPAVIGPGPDNPLGARALNWNRGDHDTLIRFHGTPNVGSIGSAASNGCVRMFDRDVIELYDLVSSGTTIVSLAG